MNLYKNGDLTHYGQKIEDCNLLTCWNQVIEVSQYHQRRQEVDNFNRCNRWKKRGIAITPNKYSVGFTLSFLNQGQALVNVYTDGSVLLYHNGVEMGQGIHTKMIQVASRVLNIPVSKIHVSESNSSCIPNSTATAASYTADLNGMAVMKACQTIMNKIAPFKENNPQGSWEIWVKSAFADRVGLSAIGHFTPNHIEFDWENGKLKTEKMFHYHSFGAVCTEVEIDCLTGDHTVLRTDIVMDVGNSLNPAVDVGQIEGGFLQGYGLFVLEEHKMSPTGELYTQGPGTYKIPSFGNIPIQFNVHLLKDHPNKEAVYSSKAIGEPPLILAMSVFFALRDAILSARQEVGIQGHFRLDSPATAERIRMACVDKFTQQFPEAHTGSHQPWTVNY